MSSKLLRTVDTSQLASIPWNQHCTPALEMAPMEKIMPAAPKASPAEIADRRVAEAEAAGERRASEAYHRGLREGEAAGRKAGHAEAEPAIQKLGESIQELAEFRPRLRLETEADMVRLAVAIARRIVNRELSCDPESITGLVRVAFEKLKMQEIVRVAVHPSHQRAIQTALERAGGGHITVSADASLACGGVVFETSRGNLDVSAETQLREIERGLTDRLRAAGV